MNLCARCGIDTDAANGVCRDCLDSVDNPGIWSVGHFVYSEGAWGDFASSRWMSREERERRDFEIWHAWLDRLDGRETARRLGIGEKTVWRYKRRMGLTNRQRKEMA